MNIRSVRNWWEVWDIQVVTISSLLLQILLMFFAPLRKRTSKAVIFFPMWLAYLLADAVPIYAMGLITTRKSGNYKDGIANTTSDHLVVFWAAFLLLHLGGPDTITAFALQDNELWRRHAFSLLMLCPPFFYASYLSYHGNELWIPTVLIFIAGLIKYTERTRSLYLASSRGLGRSVSGDPDPGPDYESLVDEYTSKVEAEHPTILNLSTDPILDTDMEMVEEKKALSDFEVNQYAHGLHTTFKGLIADLRFSALERSARRSYFLKRNSRDAYKIIVAELNFHYEILYTKGLLVHSIDGISLRIISFALSFIALAMFKSTDKHKAGYKKFDVGLTYTLLGGAIAFDAMSSLMILFSDRFAVALAEPPSENHDGSIIVKLRLELQKILHQLLFADRQRLPRDCISPLTETNRKKVKCRNTCSIGQVMQFFHCTWSKYISQYNLLDYCLRRPSGAVGMFTNLFGITFVYDIIESGKSEMFGQDLTDLIFDELKMKSIKAEDLETALKISSSRGDWVLRSEGCTNLLPWIEKIEFDESIMMWHVATELLYNTDDVIASCSNTTGDSKTHEKYRNEGTESYDCSLTEMDFKGLSKLLSGYMLSLLIWETTIMSNVAGIAQIRHNDTFAEAQGFFHHRNIGKKGERRHGYPVVQSLADFFLRTFKKCCGVRKIRREEEKHRALVEACQRILAVRTPAKASAIKGGRSKSVLFDACRLAKELNKLDEINGHNSRDKDSDGGDDIVDQGKKVDKWRLICRVWIEMMCYASCRCKGANHAATLSRGGELITSVWLLMAHFGFGDYFLTEVMPA